MQGCKRCARLAELRSSSRLATRCCCGQEEQEGERKSEGGRPAHSRRRVRQRIEMKSITRGVPSSSRVEQLDMDLTNLSIPSCTTAETSSALSNRFRHAETRSKWSRSSTDVKQRDMSTAKSKAELSDRVQISGEGVNEMLWMVKSSPKH